MRDNAAASEAQARDFRSSAQMQRDLVRGMNIPRLHNLTGAIRGQGEFRMGFSRRLQGSLNLTHQRNNRR